MRYILTLDNTDGLPAWFISSFDKKHALEDAQEAVGGYIEFVNLYTDLTDMGIDCWVNEEGKFLDLPVTIFNHDDGCLHETILGNICFLRHGKGDLSGLTKSDIKYIVESKFKDVEDVVVEGYIFDWILEGKRIHYSE